MFSYTAIVPLNGSLYIIRQYEEKISHPTIPFLGVASIIGIRFFINPFLPLYIQNEIEIKYPRFLFFLPYIQEIDKKILLPCKKEVQNPAYTLYKNKIEENCWQNLSLEQRKKNIRINTTMFICRRFASQRSVIT